MRTAAANPEQPVALDGDRAYRTRAVRVPVYDVKEQASRQGRYPLGMYELGYDTGGSRFLVARQAMHELRGGVTKLAGPKRKYC